MKVTVLRLGHRLGRDARLSTHVGLVARAFEASGIIYSGDRDQNLMNSLKETVKRWGGDFSVEYQKNWKRVIENFKGIKIHLTMYGIPFQEKIKEIRKKRNLLLIVGSEKVPGEIYNLVDYNISVTNQPHSEVAALAVFLDHLFQGKELKKKFKGGLKIIPQERGKKVLKD
jgi:tRNA (cytidine56-2'-O)-methyltransferase